MSLFNKLFGKKSTTEKSAGGKSAERSSADLANDPNLIRVFDKYGQELFISKDEWRRNVLPGAIQSHWNDPEELYGVIVNALNDGFYPDVLAASAQFYSIDSDPLRGSCVYAIALTKNGRLDEAERVLRSYVEKYGEKALALTNLAKVYAQKNRMNDAKATVWRGLEIDPNQADGLGWYLEWSDEEDGQQRLEALKQIAVLPGSWRAQIWLGRAALDAGNLNEAKGFYLKSLSRLGHAIPSDVLMQISGDLGNHGYLSELIELTEPHFQPEVHGLEAGNNLIKAHLQLGHLQKAKQIVDQLYAMKRPDWRETLSYWDTEIAKARVANSQPSQSERVELQILTIEGPVWLDPGSAAVSLFDLPVNGPSLAFIGGTADLPDAAGEPQVQMPDAPGRLSRAVPLFLAEQTAFALDARVRTLIPWIVRGGFVISGQAWSDENVIDWNAKSDAKSDYIVVIHLNSTTDPWRINARIIGPDGDRVATLDGKFLPSNPQAGLSDLTKRLVVFLEQQNITRRERTSSYQLPAQDGLADYLLRLEQLLAVRCARMETTPEGFLHGEREIIEGNLQLCLASPQNVTTRILLAQTLLTMSKVKPAAVKEFAGKIELLQKEHPLKDPEQKIVEEMFSRVHDH